MFVFSCSLKVTHASSSQPRHWLQHVLVQGKKDTEADPITVYNLISNHFGEW